MIPFPIDLIGIAGCYGILLLMYRAISDSKTHSFGARISAALISYAFGFFVFDYLVNGLLLIIETFTTIYAILGFFKFVMLNGFLFWLFDKYADRSQFTEIMNFIRISIVFGNYFRLKDVDTQEQIGTHRMKELYREVHGKPFTEDVIATPFDEQPTRFKKVTVEELKESKRKVPPEYQDQIASLRRKQRTDVSVAFRFQLMDAGFHPFLRMMEQFEIDPRTNVLSFSIIAPLERPIPSSTPAEQTRLIERTYEALHLLIDQEWFALYAPFFTDISVRCCNKHFNDAVIETVVPVMELRISMHALRQRTDRIATVTEIRSIAEIQFFQPKG